MSYHPDDTICAISSAAAGAARGLVRLSGSTAIEIAANLFQAKDGGSIRGASAAIANTGILHLPMRRPQAGADAASVCDGSLETPCELFVWPPHRSYTREPVVEFHTIGSPPILQALLAAACAAGARLAEPGEFTLRGFLAGRIDLTQAEAVLAVIDAPDRDNLRSALAQLAGGMARPLDQARNDLTQLLAELEAGLDFVEEDIRFISESEIVDRLNSLSEVLDEVERQLDSRNTERELPQVALIGPPNVGKSSLFNALRTRYGSGLGSAPGAFVPALVSPQSGTTRDYLSAIITTGDTAFELFDTAGLEVDTRVNEHTIAESAQSLTAGQRQRANVRAYCIDASHWSDNSASNRRNLPADCDIVVLTKADVLESKGTLPVCLPAVPGDVLTITTSSISASGLDELCNAIHTVLQRAASEQSGPIVSATAARCRESVRQAAAAIRLATAAAEHSAGDELVAAELRVALAELGKVVGAVYTDDLLDRIFKTFCIGK